MGFLLAFNEIYVKQICDSYTMILKSEKFPKVSDPNDLRDSLPVFFKAYF